MYLFKKRCKSLIVLLCICMVAALCPVITGSAAIIYLNDLTGSGDSTISIANQSSTDVVLNKGVPGFNGKATSDLVYSYSGTNASTGSGYFPVKASYEHDTHDADSQVIEFNIMFEDDTSEFHFSPALYNSTGYEYFLANNKLVSTSGKGYFGSLNSFIKFSPKGIYISDYQYQSNKVRYVSADYNGKYIKKDTDGSTIAVSTDADTFETGVWHTVAIKTPGLIESKSDSPYVNSAGTTVEGAYAGENKTYVCIDGVEYVIPMAQDFWGTRHIRFHVKNIIHFDNLRNYLTKDLASPSDYKNSTKPAVLASTSDKVTIQGNEISITSNMTASELETALTGADAVRVYTASNESSAVKLGDKVVAVSKSGDSIERNYRYYIVTSIEDDADEPQEPEVPQEPETYEEPDLRDGNNDLSLSSAKDNCTITNKVPGVFGKSADDSVYRLDIAGSTGTGYNFIASGGITLDTVNFEFSFAVTDDVAGMVVENSYYKTAKAANNITVDGAEVSNTIKGNVLSISGGKVLSGNTGAFDSASKNKLLYEGKPGEWINIAIVNPGYNQTGTGTEKILIYVNGIKNEIVTSAPLYGTRHMRLAPSTKSTFYLDNVRSYKGDVENYNPNKDLKPVFDETIVGAFEGNINVASGTTVGQFKQCFTKDITVRVFANDELIDVLDDADIMNAENMVVLATKNNRTTERAYSYFTINRPLNITGVKLTNADGKIIRGTTSDISRIGETYYLATTVSNKATLTSASFNAVVATYDSLGNMTYCDIKNVTVAPGTTIITSTENPVAFENVITPEGGILKAFLWAENSLEPLCDGFSAEFNGVEEYNILTIGNSYSNNSLIYLPAIAAEDGVIIRAVNLYEGGCPIEFHYGFMNGTRTGGYDHVYQHTIEGSVSLGKNVEFEDGFNTPGYTWDYITLHQKGQYSPFYHRYYTEEKPYITEIAEYVKKNSPGSEFLFFESWAPYTDRIEEKWSVYKPLCEGLERDQYIPTVFSAIKDCYLKSAAQIGNPNRVIPAGEAIYLATQKYGFTDYVDDSSTTNETFKDAAGAIYLDQSSHLTTYGKILSALTWYEYLTGHDVTQNTYQNSKVSTEDMALLKQIAHEACQIEDYIPKK